MKIKLTSVFVDNQEKALQFYTEILGFVKKAEYPFGKFRWLTVVAPEEPDGPELLLEPNANPATRTFQKALFTQGIPATSFIVADIQKEFARMKALGVVWRQEPIQAGSTIVAIFEDTCGNLIQIVQYSIP